MNNKLIPIVLTLVVGIILAGSVLMPVLDDATTTEHKIVNVGQYYMTDNDEDYTITYDPDGKFVIGDKEIPFSSLPSGNITLASTKDILLRMQNRSSQSYSLVLISESGPSTIATSSSAAPVDINFSNGVLSYGTTTRNYTSDDSVRILSDKGAYVMTDPDKPAIVLKDTTVIVGDGTTNVNAWYNRFYLEGTAEDLEVTPATGITVSDVTVNTVAIKEYKEAVTFTSVTFVATDGTNTVDATYNRVIVPAEVTAELSNHLTPGQNALVGVIPILVIVALLMLAVGAIALRRAD